MNGRSCRVAVLSALIASTCALPLTTQASQLIDVSRDSAVSVSSKTIDSRGSGFLIGERLVATAFHVIAKISLKGEKVEWTVPGDLMVTLSDGETLPAKCVSFPTEAETDPLKYDFALLDLAQKPRRSHARLELAAEDVEIAVGDQVIFSGYPLATPGMVTHRGMISGFTDDKSIIFLQAPINKGNSGGAVLSEKARALAIVSMREGGISQGLADLSTYIDATFKQGSVAIKGVDPLQSIRAIVQTLDRYISPGIGYARSTRFLREYLKRHPALLSQVTGRGDR